MRRTEAVKVHAGNTRDTHSLPRGGGGGGEGCFDFFFAPFLEKSGFFICFWFRGAVYTSGEMSR